MAARQELDRRCVRFGVFDLNVATGELRKHGVKVRLQDQPLKLLLCLLESPGELCTREALIRRIWPEGTFVDYEHGLNATVTRLRQVMGDSADGPRYVETVGRKGYRFIAPVERPSAPESVKPFTEAKEDEAAQALASVLVETSTRLPRFGRVWIGVATFAIALGAIAAVGWWRASRPLPQPLVRLSVELGAEMKSTERGNSLALSPDGTHLVVQMSGPDGRTRLATRSLDQSQLTPLPGTEGASSPFFSPDGQWVAFNGGGKLRKVSIQGGPAIALCDIAVNNGGSWGEDGNIIAALDVVLSRIPSTGGAPVRVTELAAGEIIHRWPQVLPGGKAVLFSTYTSMTGLDGANVEVISLGDRHRKTLVRGGTWGRYLPSGHLVYINKGTLLAVPFDLDRLEVRGAPTPVLEEVAYSTATGSAQLDFSRTGTLVYRSSRAGSELVTVQWLDGSGKTWPLLTVPGNYLSPTASPDGSRLALTSAGDIWVYELRRDTMMRLTFGGGYGNPLWSADGRFILFRAGRGMFWTRADGTGNPQPFTQSENQQTPWSFTADGKRLAFVEINPATGADIWTLPVENDGAVLRTGKPEVFLHTSFQERTPMFSRDGRWIAYSSNESGLARVYVKAFPDKGPKQQVSESGGTYPAWSRNGRELFFWQFGVDNHLMVASYTAQGDSFMLDKPRVWSENRLANFGTTRHYDPAPDGKRIVALVPVEGPEVQSPRDHVIFLLNFFDELRRRSP